MGGSCKFYSTQQQTEDWLLSSNKYKSLLLQETQNTYRLLYEIGWNFFPPRLHKLINLHVYVQILDINI